MNIKRNLMSEESCWADVQTMFYAFKRCLFTFCCRSRIVIASSDQEVMSLFDNFIQVKCGESSGAR